MIQLYQPHAPYQWNWVSLIGPDAQDFLHRLTTVHVRALHPGEGAKGFFLTAQGKMRAAFTLWNYRETEYAFEFDAGASGKWKNELLQTIDQYTFAEQITLSDVSANADQWGCYWIFMDHSASGVPEELKAGTTLALDEEIRLCHHGRADFGRDWITAWGRPMRLKQWIERAFPSASTVDFETTERWRIQALRPRVEAELNENTIPLEVGMKEAISDNKGCYPGQEVIERIVSLGSPARRLAKIEGEGSAPASGSAITNLAEPPVEVGQVTSSVQEGSRFVALGLVKKIHAKDGLEVRIEGKAAKVTQVAPYA